MSPSELASVTTALNVAASSSATSNSSLSTGKPVFVHYMVGGMLEEHIRQDILDAQALGIDAFALNLDQFAWWSNATVELAFKNAEELGFKLLFSFDMSDGHFDHPSEYAGFLQEKIQSPAHFRYNGVPLVTTFAGSAVSNSDWQAFKDSLETPVILMPSFYDVYPTSSFFSDRPALDGTFNWNSWPWSGDGKIPVNTNLDDIYLSAAKASNKLFMMGMSPLQYKHMSTEWNWYARGEQNFELRMGQVLAAQPDMLELQTWNDAGESHYMGTIWPEWIVDPDTNPITAYTKDLDHTGYHEILPAFIQAWKRGDTTAQNMVPTNGKSVQGVFWHHPLLAGADCSSDPLGQVGNHDIIEDLVAGVILVAEGQSGLQAVVTSGTTQLGTKTLTSGFNSFSFDGLTTGKVSVTVTDSSGSTIVGGIGPLEVVDQSAVCNYNFQVVALK